MRRRRRATCRASSPTTRRKIFRAGRGAQRAPVSPFLQRLQPSLSLLVLGGDLEHILVAALGARGQAFAAIEIAEGDQGIDEIRIDCQRALIALGGLAEPLRIALLARAEEVPGLGVIGRE